MKIKTFSGIMLIMATFLASSLSCFAADSEASNVGSTETEAETKSTAENIDLGEDDRGREILLTYQTTVIDLNTGTEYHATANNPTKINAELGHQYYINATASITREHIIANTFFVIRGGNLMINCQFEGVDTILHNYLFVLPVGTELSYVDDSLYSNMTRLLVTWEKATSAPGLSTYVYSKQSLNDGFILEVVDKTAVSTAESDVAVESAATTESETATESPAITEVLTASSGPIVDSTIAAESSQSIGSILLSIIQSLIAGFIGGAVGGLIICFVIRKKS